MVDLTLQSDDFQAIKDMMFLLNDYPDIKVTETFDEFEGVFERLEQQLYR